MDTSEYIKMVFEHAWIGASGIIAYVFRKYDKRIEDLEKMVAQQNLTLAKEYITRDELKESMENFEQAQREGSARVEMQIRDLRSDLKDFTETFIDYITKK